MYIISLYTYIYILTYVRDIATYCTTSSTDPQSMSAGNPRAQLWAPASSRPSGKTQRITCSASMSRKFRVRVGQAEQRRYLQL